jgi:hypothetical protein
MPRWKGTSSGDLAEDEDGFGPGTMSVSPWRGRRSRG